jgi:uncharacterized membrane protein YhaH (DUF805 family)
MQSTGLVALLFTYQGRVNRGKYWLAILIYIGISIVLAGIGLIMFGNSILALADATNEGVIYGLLSKGIGFALLVVVIYIPMLVSSIFVGIKRLHDRDKSGWWLLLFYLAPAVLNEFTHVSFIFALVSLAISIWAFVELGCLRGTVGPNKHGPDPRPS